MSARTQARMRCALLAALASCAAAVPATASAAKVSAVPIGPDFVSELPIAVAISGVADVPSTLTVGWARLDEGCRPILAADVLDDHPVSGPFSFEQRGVVDEAGPHILCAFLEEDGYRLLAASLTHFTARAPRATLTIQAPPVAALGRPVAIRVRGSAEVPRNAFGKLAPPMMPCSAALASAITPRLGAHTDATTFDLYGTFRLDQYGTWKVCAQAVDGWLRVDSTSALALAEAPIRVTVRCTAASRELSRARDRWRAMSRRLRLRGLPPSPHLRIRGMAVRRVRTWVAEACASGA